MLLRRALPATRQSLAHSFPVYEMGSRIHFRPFTYLIEKLLPSGGKKNAHQPIFLTMDSLPLAKDFSCFPDWPSFLLCKK